MTQERKYLWSLIVLFLATLPLVNPVTRGDGFYYVAHLRSAVVDHDLYYANELRFADEKTKAYLEPFLERYGRLTNKYSIGAPILWAPYYVPVHIASLTLRNAGYDIPADGFGRQYLWAVGLATAIYAFAGLLLLYQLLRRYFRASAALATILAIWFATSLPAYV